MTGVSVVSRGNSLAGGEGGGGGGWEGGGVVCVTSLAWPSAESPHVSSLQVRSRATVARSAT